MKVVLINVFMLEFFSYLYLLYLAWHVSNFYLIGNQKGLDALLKIRLADGIQAQLYDPWRPYRVDSRLGYVLAENKTPPGWPKQVNSRGMVADREYSIAPPQDKFRIVAIGDSFVHCDGEVTQHCWTYFLEQNFRNVEVLNFGVGGYGLGQSYLRFFQDGIVYQPDLVILNYLAVTERDVFDPKNILSGRGLNNADLYRVDFGVDNGIVRSRAFSPLDLFRKNVRDVLIYKRAGIDMKRMIWSSPFFSVSNTGVLIKQAVLKKILPPRVKSLLMNSNIQVNLHILRDLFEAARCQDFDIIITHRNSYQTSFEDMDPLIGSLLQEYADHVALAPFGEAMNQWIVTHGLKEKELMNQTNHYNAKGNAIYANLVMSFLKSKIWGGSERVFRFLPEENQFQRIK